MRSRALDKKSFLSLAMCLICFALVMNVEPSMACELESIGSFDLVEIAPRLVSDMKNGDYFVSNILLFLPVIILL